MLIPSLFFPVDGVDINFSSSEIIINSSSDAGKYFTMSCTINNTFWTNQSSLVSLSLQKSSCGGPQTLATVLGNGLLQVDKTNLTCRASFETYFDSDQSTIPTLTMAIEMTELACKDGGEYFCELNYRKSNNEQIMTIKVAKNLTVKSKKFKSAF